jgi:hypothetical protein
MKPTFASNPPQPGPPEPWGPAPEADGSSAGSGQPAQYFVVPTLYAYPADSADEGETRMILEMRYQEYAARHALEALFESGELESLAL